MIPIFNSGQWEYADVFADSLLLETPRTGLLHNYCRLVGFGFCYGVFVSNENSDKDRFIFILANIAEF